MVANEELSGDFTRVFFGVSSFINERPEAYVDDETQVKRVDYVRSINNSPGKVEVSYIIINGLMFSPNVLCISIKYQ